MKTLKYFILLFGILLISNVYSLGCCVDSSMGACSPNSLQESCTGENAQFYADQTCSSVSECGNGCCSIGLESKYTLESTCYYLAQAQGLEYTWSTGTLAECVSSSGSTDTGACIINTKYDSVCSFTAKKNCQGTFYKDMLCSNPTLNTTCEETSDTMCYNGNAYYKDSCGNPDEKKETCDYNSGSVCELNDNKEAICKDLNCVDKFGTARTNGDSWCIGLDGNVLTQDIRSVVFKKTNEKPEGFQDNVGSRFFKQFCLNGEVYTDPCGDYREEVCIPSNGTGEAKCISNKAGDCLMANTEEINQETGSKVDEALCDSEFCFVTRLDDCVDFGVEGHEMVCGENRANWRDYAADNGLSEDVSEVTSGLLAELAITMCVPKVTTGSDISGSSYSEDGECSIGDFEASVFLDHDKSASRWRVKEDSDSNTEVDSSAEPKRWGNAGIISLNNVDWRFPNDNGIDWCGTNNPLNIGKANSGSSNSGGWWTVFDDDGPTPSCNDDVAWCCNGDEYKINKKAVSSAIGSGSIADPKLIELLNQRTVGLGDCAGDSNWAGEGGPGENTATTTSKKADSDRKDQMIISLSYLSNSWSAPSGGSNCAKCGTDGLPCSEYRCQSLGKRCEYYEPADGAEKSYCVSSDDSSPPTISSSISPQSPIAPFSSVQITINTNEDSYCKFNIGEAGNNFDEMKYDVDYLYSTSHSAILNVPGKITINDSDATPYSLITDDGQYEMYVRCEDVAGNWNLAAYLVSFEVMQTPDEVPPLILNFTPAKGSAIKFNTTEKEISMKLNEPAECRWSLEDVTYEEMGKTITATEENETYESNTNQLNCDTEISDFNILNGYYCSGILTNVTLDMTKTTNYYIRCKDQPWLEGNEDEYYQRNTNTVSTIYTLRPSNKLEITEISPAGDLTLSPGTTNITLTARTKGGGYSDVANCKWRIKYADETTVLYPFSNTNSNKHTQTITNKTEGDYTIEVVCTDAAGNIANETKYLKLRYDRTAPIISRIYNSKGTIKLTTDEPAICKFVNILDLKIGCAFSVDDNKSISMNSNKLLHSMKLTKGLTYYIKCQDYYGNQNSICNIISKIV